MAVPAVLELWLLEGNLLAALGLLSLSLLPVFFVDTLINREIEGYIEMSVFYDDIAYCVYKYDSAGIFVEKSAGGQKVIHWGARVQCNVKELFEQIPTATPQALIRYASINYLSPQNRLVRIIGKY